MIIFISDFDLRGSGYMNISVALCGQLSERFGNVLALGIGYDGSEHNWPYSIIPVAQPQAFAQIPAMVNNLFQLSQAGQFESIDAIVVTLDIPMHERLLSVPRFGVPYVGIFPVESGPLCQSWANVISHMDSGLVISKFGKRLMDDRSVEGEYIPIGIDTESWREPIPEERISLRKAMGFDPDDFVVLTVADNQERKNLAGAAQAISKASRVLPNLKWALVTRLESHVGWKIDDLLVDLKIADRVMKFERGLPFDRLWMLYACADAFLLTSKAEGLCMPVIEAMATGLPVIATDCTALPEHLYSEVDWARECMGQWEQPPPPADRGFPISVQFWATDPWGNSQRAFINTDHAADTISEAAALFRNSPDVYATMKKVCRDYALSRTWDLAGEVLEVAVNRAMSAAETKEASPEKNAPITPNTVPQAVPIRIGGTRDDQEES